MTNIPTWNTVGLIANNYEHFSTFVAPCIYRRYICTSLNRNCAACGRPFFNKTMRQSCLAWSKDDYCISAKNLLGLRYKDHRIVVHQSCVPAIVRYIRNSDATGSAHEVAAVLRELQNLDLRSL